MPATDATCELITIPISHYCEKARWALDRAGVRYRERAHMQVIHRFAVRRAGGGTTAPVLVCNGQVLAESADIVDFADSRCRPEERLFPDDPAQAAETRELEREFDARLGPESRRWMYDRMRGRRDLATTYGTTGVPTWQRRAFPLGYGLITRIVERFLEVTPEKADESERVVRTTFDEVAARLADGRRYLMGERFTAADLTFAALAAAVLMPPEYSVPLPQPDVLPADMAAVVRELRAHPAGAHAMAMFRDERHRRPA
jgi:glutathione S-transferase